MTDEDRSETELLPVMGNGAQNRIFPDGVLSGRRLIEENDLRICHESPCQGDALLHAARKLGGIFGCCFREVGLFDSGHHLFLDFLRAHGCRLPQGQGNIVKDRHGVEKGVVLKEVTDLAPVLIPFALPHLVNGFSPETGSSPRQEKGDR